MAPGSNWTIIREGIGCIGGDGFGFAGSSGLVFGNVVLSIRRSKSEPLDRVGRLSILRVCKAILQNSEFIGDGGAIGMCPFVWECCIG